MKLNIEVWWRSYFMAKSVLRHTHSHSTHAFENLWPTWYSLIFYSYIYVCVRRKEKEVSKWRPTNETWTSIQHIWCFVYIIYPHKYTHTHVPCVRFVASSKYTRICFMSHNEKQINEKEKKAMRLKIKCSSIWIWERVS